MINPYNFNLSLKCSTHQINFGNLSSRRFIKILIVDDDYIIRNSINRILLKEIKERFVNVELLIIEATDGVETLLALYLAKIHNFKIDAIISDENMNFMSGSSSAKIVEGFVKNNSISDISFYIVSAIDTSQAGNYPVKKIFSKPIDKRGIGEILNDIVT